MQLPMTGGMELREHGPEEGLSRGELVRRGALVAGGVAALGLVAADPALGAKKADPSPIPGGLDENFQPVPKDPFIHVLPPAIGFDMSTITDFIGVVAAADIQGTARGSDGSTYTFDADMRFMQGLYVGRDGRLRQGSFGFI